MAYTAVMKFEGYLGKAEFVIKDQFFGPLNFMGNDILFDSYTGYLGKKVGQITVAITQFLTDKNGFFL